MIRRLSQSFLLAFSNIRSNFFHTFLSVLGIVIGVGALVSILSLIDGMEEFARNQITQTTSVNAIIVQTNAHRDVNGVRLRKDTFSIIDYDHFSALRGTLTKPVRGVLKTSLSAEVKIDSQKIGVYAWPTATRVRNDTAKFTGSLYTEEEVKARQMVVVVNQAFADASKMNHKELIGKSILFRDLKLTITGIVHESKNKTPQIYFPITLLSEKDLRDHPPELFFDAAKTEDIPTLKTEIKSWLDKKYATDNFTIVTNDFRVEQAAQGFLLFKVIMGLIVGISVIVGGVGVMNVLLISVTERTTEIGIRKAVGANNRDIVLLFLSESITVSAFGSFIGLIFGTLFTMAAIPIVKSLTKIPFQASYTIDTFLIISIIAVLVGVVFGTYPAIRASKLDPVEAIRHE
jgi:putative ABC transport system permease protein